MTPYRINEINIDLLLQEFCVKSEIDIDGKEIDKKSIKDLYFEKLANLIPDYNQANLDISANIIE